MAPRVLMMVACCSMLMLQACGKEAPEETATQVMRELAAELATNENADQDILGAAKKICDKYQISVEEFGRYLANHKEAQDALAEYINEQAKQATLDPKGDHARELKELEERVGKVEKELAENEAQFQEKAKKVLEEQQAENSKKKKELEEEIEKIKAALQKGS